MLAAAAREDGAGGSADEPSSAALPALGLCARHAAELQSSLVRLCLQRGRGRQVWFVRRCAWARPGAPPRGCSHPSPHCLGPGT